MVEETDCAPLRSLTLLDYTDGNGPTRSDLDIVWTVLTREGVDLMHQNGIEVNVWNVDEIDLAERLLSWGVDYLTSDILE